MHGLSNVDPGMKIDWGKTSIDYAKYRPGPPLSFYKKLKQLGVGHEGQAILHLGTGTGVLARQFAKQGCKVIGTDVSNEQVKMAETLAKMENLHAEFKAVPTEEISFVDERSFKERWCFDYFAFFLAATSR